MLRIGVVLETQTAPEGVNSRYLMNRNGYDEKASDLGRGRRPKLKSEDFSSYPFRFMIYRDVKLKM